MALLAVRDLTFTYPGDAGPALNRVELTVDRGEYVLLCGLSGSGKSTLLRHLKSALQPYGKREGRVLLEGRPLEQIDAREQALRVGFVMQDPQAQIVTDKVWHELAFGMENLGMDQNTIRLRSAEMASYFGIQDWFRRETAELSGGQKQLLNLASVMAMQPDILILDEPTSQLDPIAASDFLNTLKKINRELGTAVLVTEHRTEEIFPAADRVVVMDQGCIIADGSPESIGIRLHEEHSPLFGVLPAPARIFYGAGGRGDAPLTVREGRRWLAGRIGESPQRTAPAQAMPKAKPALEFRGAWFRYERTSPDILRGTSFQVPEGSLFALVGGNGTGKSTSLKAACGICRLYRGEIYIFGRKLSSWKNGFLFHNCLAMLPQNPAGLFVHATVREDLQEMNSDAEKIARMAERFALTELMDSHPGDLSGGELQRAAMAKVLLTEPRLLLLDEPTKGVDCSFKEKLAEILKELCRSGMTIVMVSHDVEFCARHADMVGMFFDGDVLAADTPDRFFGANSFYTTAACRMSRGSLRNAVTAESVLAMLEEAT